MPGSGTSSKFRFCTSTNPEEQPFMFLVNHSTQEVLARILKVDLAIALGCRKRQDCPGCRQETT